MWLTTFLLIMVMWWSFLSSLFLLLSPPFLTPPSQPSARSCYSHIIHICTHHTHSHTYTYLHTPTHTHTHLGSGTGAIMGVPGHDERDMDFATQHKLPVKKVITSTAPQEETGKGEWVSERVSKWVIVTVVWMCMCMCGVCMVCVCVHSNSHFIMIEVTSTIPITNYSNGT